MTDVILVINCGSSSIKAAAYAVEERPAPVWKGNITGIGSAPVYRALSGTAAGERMALATDMTTHRSLIHWMLERLGQEMPSLRVVAAGHRVVHGGRHFDAPALIDDTVLETIQGLSDLAPGHQPHNLSGIHAIAEAWPEIPQVACFDTAFHRTQPRVAQLFALPRHFADEGVLRYGFHGLSYEYIASVLPRHAGSQANGRFIVAHLGNGASLCAMQEGRSVATTMGFTALDGLMMGKRCGDLDPGVIMHLLRDRGMSVDEVYHLIRRESGLLGVSGISNDMRDLLESDDPRAQEAIELFVHRIVSQLGALVAQLGGLDGLVFTAGIGERSAPIRERIAARLAWLGVRLDPAANAEGASCISTTDSALPVFVIPTDEEGVIAAHTRTLACATPRAQRREREALACS
ncbi:acetate kinase [Modicisalibacter ilicicola DSM 19980]|uniref:Acetate kinase n=1 Tax=Modicisalibacter ilicicola DSM 19980 TaxID=1121942 RepID=A0A1M4UX49_9GAMM|nr:acetate/propionate family kinase [Halomonas ilicicola]SHE61239.1 acetate kinase [Halomonas ilicicola DSM 19980]